MYEKHESQWTTFEKDMESRKEQGKVFTEDEIFMILNKAKKQDVLKRQKIEFIKIIDENNKKIDQLKNTNELIIKYIGEKNGNTK